MPPPRDCPCHSKRRYAECCAPFHKGLAVPETAGRLMRSRYSGFALGLGAYLLDTLASTHPDRAQADAHELGSSRRGQRFMDLCIMHESSHEADAAEVLFYARLFEKGVDHSFVELSKFVREDGRWRYASGELVAAESVEGDPRSLTRAGFDTLIRREAAS